MKELDGSLGISGMGSVLLPNGSRLSCGRNAGGRKAAERADKKAGQRGNAIPPYLRAPDSFKRLLGGGMN